ncbi:MAG: PDZ domain-containing protein [Nibricoccus sp.]
MKNHPQISKMLLRITAGVALVLAVLPVSAQTTTKIEKREKISHAPAPTQEVTYLGVVSVPAMPAISAQLELPAETGLVIVQITPDSPAAGILKVNDLMVRLDDQILIEPRQLGVLIRSKKEGDEVKITFYRAGKQQSAQVKLGKHTVPQAAERGKMFNRHILMGSGPRLQTGMPDAHMSGLFVPGTPSKEIRIAHFEPKEAVMFFDDGSGRLELSFKEGKKQLTALDLKGEVVFKGPVETPEERKAMPAEVRERFEKMESTDVRMPGPGRGAMSIRSGNDDLSTISISDDEDDQDSA